MGEGRGWTNGLSMTQPMVWSCWIHSEWLSGGEGGGGRGGGWTNGLSMTQPMVWSCWIHSEWLSGGEGGGGEEGGGPMASL